MAELYLLANAPAPTTAAPVPVATGTAIKTLLQVMLGTQTKGKVVEWGISFDASAAAVPIRCPLAATGASFATVTGSGYTASAEGSIVATRLLDLQLVAPTNQYVKQFPLGREPVIDVSKALRVRVTAPVTVNAYTYLILEI